MNTYLNLSNDEADKNNKSESKIVLDTDPNKRKNSIKNTNPLFDKNIDAGYSIKKIKEKTNNGMDIFNAIKDSYVPGFYEIGYNLLMPYHKRVREIGTNALGIVIEFSHKKSNNGKKYTTIIIILSVGH